MFIWVWRNISSQVEQFCVTERKQCLSLALICPYCRAVHSPYAQFKKNALLQPNLICCPFPFTAIHMVMAEEVNGGGEIAINGVGHF